MRFSAAFSGGPIEASGSRLHLQPTRRPFSAAFSGGPIEASGVIRSMRPVFGSFSAAFSGGPIEAWMKGSSTGRDASNFPLLLAAAPLKQPSGPKPDVPPIEIFRCF